MPKYHLSDDGNPRPCRAQQGNCPISGELEHFDNPEKAREYYEVVVQGAAFSPKKFRSHEERVADLPKVSGIQFEAHEDSADHVRDDGVPYSNVEAFRTNRSGKKISVAAITIYDDGEVSAHDISEGLLSDIDANDDISDALNKKYTVNHTSSKAFYRPKDPSTVVRQTHEKRVEGLPKVKDVLYEPEPWNAGDVTEEGIAYSSINVYREGRTGKKSPIAELTVYDNGDAIIWNKTGANAADLKTCDKFVEAIKGKYKISPYSSHEFRM